MWIAPLRMPRDKVLSDNISIFKGRLILGDLLSVLNLDELWIFPQLVTGLFGRLGGLGGICAFPSVAHCPRSKPLPLSTAICFQPCPTGRKHEHFHHQDTDDEQIERVRKKRIAHGTQVWPMAKTSGEGSEKRVEDVNLAIQSAQMCHCN